MKKYEYRPGERLTEIRLRRVWLDKDLLPENSDFRSMYPSFWEAIDEEIDFQDRGFRFELKDIKKLILTARDMYIIFIHTEIKSISGKTIGQRAYLSNRDDFIDITFLMGFTNLCGCRFEILNPPYEDFINEFIGEVYF